MWRFCFTEMFNNAIDHSGGMAIHVHILRTAIDTEMSISDDGNKNFQYDLWMHSGCWTNATRFLSYQREK